MTTLAVNSEKYLRRYFVGQVNGMIIHGRVKALLPGSHILLSFYVLLPHWSLRQVEHGEIEAHLPSLESDGWTFHKGYDEQMEAITDRRKELEGTAALRDKLEAVVRQLCREVTADTSEANAIFDGR